jgi:hypothetical protein
VTDRLEHAEQLLAERGRDVGRVRVAAGRSGVVVGFPTTPMIHISWLVLAAVPAIWLWRRRR